MAILHTLLELKGYTPNNFEQSIYLALVIKKLHYSRISVDKAANLIQTLIKNKELRYAIS